MSIKADLIKAFLGPKKIDAVKTGMFIGQCVEIYKSYSTTGKLPQGVKLMIDPEILVGMIEQKVKLNDLQKKALLKVAGEINKSVNEKAESYGKKKTTKKRSKRT